MIFSSRISIFLQFVSPMKLLIFSFIISTFSFTFMDIVMPAALKPLSDNPTLGHIKVSLFVAIYLEAGSKFHVE